MDVSIDGAGGEHVGMMWRPVDIGDGAVVGMKDVFDGLGAGVVEVPDKQALVRGRGDPRFTRNIGAPLHVRNFPFAHVRQNTRQEPRVL